MSAYFEKIYLDPSKVNKFAALCGDRSVIERDSDLLPLGWHQLFTHASDPWLSLGVDGHPHVNTRDVPAHLNKRMWASTEVWVTQPIPLGILVTCEREKPIVAIKYGNSGELALSREVTRWRRGGRLLLEETKTIVYKSTQCADQLKKTQTSRQAVPIPDTQQALKLDEISLFKYSALIEVSHRIHFDHPYATNVEGYPGLVIHGPLLVQLLLNLARISLSSFICGTYTARALRPNYLGMALQLNLARRDDHVVLWVSDGEDQPTLVLTLQP